MDRATLSDWHCEHCGQVHESLDFWAEDGRKGEWLTLCPITRGPIFVRAANIRAISLATEEAQAIFQMIDELSGGNASNVFAHDSSNSLEDMTTRAAVKLFRAAGRESLIPENLR